MMNSPEGYKKRNENKSIKELVLERTKLFNEIVEYESRHIMNNEPYRADEITKPSAKDIYNMQNLYLKEITDLITKSNGFKDRKAEYEAEHIKKLKKLETKLYSKDCFFIEIKSGAVYPKYHSKYYGGVEIDLVRLFGNTTDSKVRIGTEEYSVNNDQFKEIEELVKDSLTNLIDIAKRQSIDEYEGGYNSIFIKIGTILLKLSSMNTTTEADSEYLNGFETKIINILSVASNNIARYIYNEGVDKSWIKEIIQKDLNSVNDDMNREPAKIEFYKKNANDKIWWIDNPDNIGENLISFDKKKIYNLFKDYPYNLSDEEKELFDKENPYWANFFKDHQKSKNNSTNSIKESNSDKIKNEYTYSFDDYKKLFEKDNDSFIRLIIPSSFLKMILDTNNSEDMNLIGKKNLDFTTDEVIVLKKYAGYVYNHILDPNGQKNIDKTVSVLTDVIEHLPKGTEISISQILGKNCNNYNTKELFEIDERVLSSCKEKGIVFNFDKYKDQAVGLPFNIPFIIE